MVLEKCLALVVPSDGRSGDNNQVCVSDFRARHGDILPVFAYSMIMFYERVLCWSMIDILSSCSPYRS